MMKKKTTDFIEKKSSFKKRCSKKKCDIYLISQRGFTFLISFMIFFQLFLVLDLFPDNFIFEIPSIQSDIHFFGIIISIILNSICLFFIGNYTNQIELRINFSETITKIVLWSMMILFLITWLGYLEAKTLIENYLLSTISFLLAYFILMITLEEKQ